MLSLFGRRQNEEVNIISRIGCIYIIKNKCNSKVYIGQTTQGVEARWKQHLKPSSRKRNNYKLYRAMNKYGVGNFYYEVLEDNIEYEDLDDREESFIEKYDSFHNGYNSTPGGDLKTIYKIDDIESIINKLKHGELIIDIANEYNVCTSTIRRTLQSYGIHTPSDIQILTEKQFLRTLPREKIRELYECGKSHSEIAKELNVDQRSVSRVVKEFGIGKKKIIDYKSLDYESVLKEYEEKVIKGNMKKKDFDKEHGFNQHSIKMLKKLRNIS